VAQRGGHASHRLVLLRHAKSSWAAPDADDHERPLNARGRRACELLAAHFATQDPPDLVLCSDARRTRETLERIRGGFSKMPQIAIEDGLYLASAKRLRDRIADLPEETGSVMLIGHNPGMQELAQVLASHSAPKLRRRVAEKFPTAAAAGFRVEGPWEAVGGMRTALTDYVTPADLSEEIGNED
jgi:phosphohistidine phosphatase